MAYRRKPSADTLIGKENSRILEEKVKEFIEMIREERRHERDRRNQEFSH